MNSNKIKISECQYDAELASIFHRVKNSRQILSLHKNDDVYSIAYIDNKKILNKISRSLQFEPSKFKNTVLIGEFDVPHVVETMANNPQVSSMLSQSSPLFYEGLELSLNQTKANKFGQKEIFSREWRRYSDTSLIIEMVEMIARKQGLFAAFSDLFLTVAKELLSNAFFNAPFDFGANVAIFRDLSRSSEVLLPEDKPVRISIAESERSLTLSIEDRFGSLVLRDFFQNLIRAVGSREQQIKKNSVGSGVGFFTSLNIASLMMIETQYANYTKVSAAFYKTKRQREFEELGRSLIVKNVKVST